MPQLDFENALFMHTGLTGWVLMSTDIWVNYGRRGMIVKYIRPEDKTALIQRAVFTIRDGALTLTIEDQPRIIGLEMGHFEALYRRDDDANRG